MSGRRRWAMLLAVTTYLLHHRHAAKECPVAFAAWKGFDSPLRGRPALASCATGGHALWWTVEAADRAAAEANLPPYLAARCEVVEVSEVRVPGRPGAGAPPTRRRR